VELTDDFRKTGFLGLQHRQQEGAKRGSLDHFCRAILGQISSIYGQYTSVQSPSATPAVALILVSCQFVLIVDLYSHCIACHSEALQIHCIILEMSQCTTMALESLSRAHRGLSGPPYYIECQQRQSMALESLCRAHRGLSGPPYYIECQQRQRMALESLSKASLRLCEPLYSKSINL
jgi:hypothetical protein